MALPIRSLPGQRQVIINHTDPKDKSTIVSIFPKIVTEIKYTAFPGAFVIPPGTYDNPGILVVGQSSWYYDLNENAPAFGITIRSAEMADSIVKDWCNSMLEASVGERVPGLFFIDKELDPDPLKASIIVKRDYKPQLDEAKRLQHAWFTRLIDVADALWATSNGSPRSISDDMRIAAREVGRMDKPWMENVVTASKIKCKACGNLRDPNYPICPTCKYIDQDKAKELGLKFATA